MTPDELQKLALRHPERNAHLLGVGGLQTAVGQRDAAAALERKPSRTKKSRKRMAHRGKPVLRVTLVAFRARLCDADNGIAGYKWMRDAIASWFGFDDAEGAGIAWEYEQVETAGEPGTAVRITLLRI